MTPKQHYEEAERLIAEGEKVVTRIGNLSTLRHQAARQENVRDYTQRMDELGKKAMGIWAQAQVHATLAITPFDVSEPGFR